MIKDLFKLVILTLFFKFILINLKTRHIFGVFLKQISSFSFRTVKYENSEKWIIDNPRWITSQKLKPSY